MDRASDKERARADDLERLAAGEITAAELRRENGFCSALPLHLFKIVSIGNKSMRKPEDGDDG